MKRGETICFVAGRGMYFSLVCRKQFPLKNVRFLFIRLNYIFNIYKLENKFIKEGLEQILRGTFKVSYFNLVRQIKMRRGFRNATLLINKVD